MVCVDARTDGADWKTGGWELSEGEVEDVDALRELQVGADSAFG